MRLIVKMASMNKKPIEITELKNLTQKQKKQIAIANQLKADGYKILPVSVEEFLR
ncbi:MAG: hypothetical protein IKA36_03515 [Clostridia bacterium]|nr:hypothetical protein [Clostridia bacterium]